MDRSGKVKLVSAMIIICIAIAATPIIAFSSEQQEKKEESFYSQLIRAVVRIEEHRSICTPGREWAIERDVPVGSAFFVHDRLQREEETEVNRFFIVTARHVVERRAELFARVQIKPRSPRTAVILLPRELWVFHPGPNPQGLFPIDVAVMLIPATPFLKTFLHCADDDNPSGCGMNETTKKPLRNQVGRPPSVLDRAVFFGFPGGDVATHAVDPFARAGVVAYTATNPELRIDGRLLADNSVFLVDAPSFPGNSGGPLLRERFPLQGGVHLWGLVTGGNLIGKDYAIVTSVKRIRETLVRAREIAKLNKEAWHSKPPQLRLRCVPEANQKPNQ